ncbi:MAG TPA: hypothetical protein P5571_15170 [Candidatus Krumholzibacteria bacterium]|nr:hypothetical protein [Candidatus Krumholzibacteria bacterium]
MRIHARTLMAFAILMILASACWSDELPPPPSYIEVEFAEWVNGTPVVYATPGGHSGYGFNNCFGDYGSWLDATLDVTVMKYGAVTANFPADQIKLVIVAGDSQNPGTLIERSCNGAGSPADYDTGRDGHTKISAERIFAYGTTLGAPYDIHYAIYVDWTGGGVFELEYLGTNVEIRTADLNFDGAVDLEDVGALAGYHLNGVYDSVADFNNDGYENLADVQMFAVALGESCTAAKAGGASMTVEEVLALMEKAGADESASWSSLKAQYR